MVKIVMTTTVLFGSISLADESPKGKGKSRLIDEMGTAIGMGNVQGFNDLLPRLKNINESLNPIGETPLTLAAYNNQHEMVSALIARGADVNYQTKNKYSALIFAAMAMRPPIKNAVKTVEILLKAGAKKGLKNIDGDSAYDLALKKGHKELASLLK